MSEEHVGVAGGHYTGKSIVRKIFQAQLWWKTIHMDTKILCRRGDICHRTGKPSHCDEMCLAS